MILLLIHTSTSARKSKSAEPMRLNDIFRVSNQQSQGGRGDAIDNWTNGISGQNPRRRYAETCEGSIVQGRRRPKFLLRQKGACDF
jgi:hypothetical protein